MTLGTVHAFDWTKNNYCLLADRDTNIHSYYTQNNEGRFDDLVQERQS